MTAAVMPPGQGIEASEAASATSHGCLSHVRIADAELELVSRLLHSEAVELLTADHYTPPHTTATRRAMSRSLHVAAYVGRKRCLPGFF